MNDFATDSEISFDPAFSSPEDWEAFETLSSTAETVMSVDNIRDYSGAFFALLFGIGMIAGLLFGKFSSWRGI